jgi:D-glycero-alpha-D-manno-heptose-7-phosphate kinase
VRVIARAPTRLDLGGGWTDVPPVAGDLGGAVTAIAIARHATVTLEVASGAPDRPSMDALARAALRRAGLHNVHATINSNFPLGAGLGGSSAAGIALQGAIAAWRGEFVEPLELVERARLVETEDLKVAGGWQDYCAAAFGGALAMRFGGPRPAVRPLALDDAQVAALEARTVLVYTGESRLSSRTITGVIDAWGQARGDVRANLTHMRDLALDMERALEAGDWAALADQVRAHWTRQRALHEDITTERIEALIAGTAAVGARGYKALGASGGGCVLLLAEPADVENVRRVAGTLGEVLPFTIARTGVQITVAR